MFKKNKTKLHHLKNLSNLAVNFFPFFAVGLGVLIIIQSVTYKGFFEKNLHFDFGLVMFMFVLYALLTKYFILSHWRKEDLSRSIYHTFSNLNKLVLSGLFVLGVFFSVMESVKYNNYVYSTFHVNPENFWGLVQFCFLILVLQLDSTTHIGGVKIFQDRWDIKNKTTHFLNKGLISKSELVKKSIFHKLVEISIFFGLLWVVVSGASGVLGSIFDQVKDIFLHPLASYSQKMHTKWGVFYDYMQLIVKNVPSDMSIYNPPQNIRGIEGNQFLIRSFLFPRILISAQRVSWSIAKSEADYVMVTDSWPEFEPPRESFVYLPKNVQVFWKNFLVYFPDRIDKIDNLSEIDSDGDKRIVENNSKEKHLSIIYNSSNYDYWGRSYSRTTAPDNISVDVLVNQTEKVSVVAGFKLQNGATVVLSSLPNDKKEDYVRLTITNIQAKLDNITKIQGLPQKGATLSFVALNPGQVYLHSGYADFGLIKIDKNGLVDSEKVMPKYYNDAYFLNLYRVAVYNSSPKSIEKYRILIYNSTSGFVIPDDEYNEVEKTITGRK